MHTLFQRTFSRILFLGIILFPLTVCAELYKGQMDGVGVSFEYPKDWKTREIQGKEEKFFEISIQGPRNSDDSYSSALSVTMYPKGRFASIEDAINDYKTKYAKFKEFKIVSSDIKGLEVEYVLKLPLHSKNARDVKIREKVMFVMKDGNCFKLRWNSAETDYSKYLPSFHTMCETFQ